MFKLLHPTELFNFVTDKLGLFNFRARIALGMLNKKAEKCKNTDDYIALSNEVFQHFPYRYFGWPIKRAQVHEEIETLLAKICDIKVNTMLEIGTFNGGTLFLFSKMVNSDAKIISLDMPGGRWGGGYEKFKLPFYTNFAHGTQKIYLIRANSHSPSSLQKVESILKGETIDFLFIDGDHSYDGVKADFEMYGQLVRKGGLIVFHDICIHPAAECNVSSFWSEIKQSYKHEEIIKNPAQNWAGIGLIYS